MSAATALVKAPAPSPSLAADAVRIALDKAGMAQPNAVLLFLSSDYARDPEPALRAAARNAGCLQIAGCTASGLFTEEEWVLDTPAAAALVLGGDYRLQPPRQGEPVLTISAPNALDWHWLAGGGRRYGGVSGDATGQGLYQVWQTGRLQAHGRSELSLTSGRVRIGVSQGARPLQAPVLLTGVDGHDLLSLAGEPALTSLLQALPPGMNDPGRLPLHLIMLGVVQGGQGSGPGPGDYHLLPVLSVNNRRHCVTVAAELAKGSLVYWAIREPHTAEAEMHDLIESLAADTQAEPRFALMFPCMGRGPSFYGGTDRDIRQFVHRFPDVPLIGFYGNGEIAHVGGANRLLQYSTVLALFYDALPA